MMMILSVLALLFVVGIAVFLVFLGGCIIWCLYRTAKEDENAVGGDRR